MVSEAITLELDSKKPASKNMPLATPSSSFSYLSAGLQSSVDDLLAQMALMSDPFKQMDFIVQRLMPAVLEAQEESIGSLAPMVESNKEYNQKLAGLQKSFKNWGAQANGAIGADGETKFFSELNKDVDGSFRKKLEADGGYAVRDEMLESMDRIETDAAAAVEAGGYGSTSSAKEKAAWDAMGSPSGAYNKSGVWESFDGPEENNPNAAKAREATMRAQPFLDQTVGEMEILKGLNANVAKKVEVELKYKVEFYNSYVSSTGSIEDNTSKQRRALVDRQMS